METGTTEPRPPVLLVEGDSFTIDRPTEIVVEDDGEPSFTIRAWIASDGGFITDFDNHVTGKKWRRKAYWVPRFQKWCDVSRTS